MFAPKQKDGKESVLRLDGDLQRPIMHQQKIKCCASSRNWREDKDIEKTMSTTETRRVVIRREMLECEKPFSGEDSWKNNEGWRLCFVSSLDAWGHSVPWGCLQPIQDWVWVNPPYVCDANIHNDMTPGVLAFDIIIEFDIVVNMRLYRDSTVGYKVDVQDSRLISELVRKTNCSN